MMNITYLLRVVREGQMINLKQFKVSVILGIIYTVGYYFFKIILILLGHKNDIYLMFFQDGLWYLPFILAIVYFFLSSSCFYLIFRVSSFIINKVTKN